MQEKQFKAMMKIFCPVCGRYDTVQWDIDYGVEKDYDMQIKKICRGDECYDED